MDAHSERREGKPNLPCQLWGRNVRSWNAGAVLRRYLGQAIKKGPYFVDSLEQASVIMVDDYCHKLEWLAYTHSEADTQARQTYY